MDQPTDDRQSDAPGPPNRPPDIQTSLSVGADGALRWSVLSRPPQGEAGTAHAARALVEYLNRRGQGWNLPTPPSGRESGVDQVATGPLGELRMQVTRVPTDEAYYRRLGHQGHVAASSTIGELAEDLIAGIRHKAHRGQESLNVDRTLVLDAESSIAHGLLQVLDEFDMQYHAEAAAAGFREIWLVTAMHVHRLIPGEWKESSDEHVA